MKRTKREFWTDMIAALSLIVLLLGFVTWSICPAPIFGYHGPACLCSECISIGEDERDYRHGGDR